MTLMNFRQIKLFFSNWYFSDYCLAWILFFSILYQKLAPLGFIFWALSSFKTWEIKSFSLFFQKIISGNTKWFLLYYLLLAIGMLWTDNIGFGFSKLENKLSFLVFPVLFLGTKTNSNSKQWKIVIIYSLALSLVINEGVAIIRSLVFSNQFSLSFFYDSIFCINMHRSYYAAYLTLGILFLLELQEKRFNILYSFLILLFGIGIFQTMSKIGIISLLLILVTYCLVIIMRKSRKKGVIAILSMIVLFLSLLSIEKSALRTRFQAVKTALSDIKTENNAAIESNAARLIMWNTSCMVIGQNWMFGTGTGDYNDELTNLNKKLNNSGVAKEQLNSHNQFLNSWVQLGLLGLFVLIMMFVSSFQINGNNLSGILILVTFLINFLVESFLETQSGIILFCILLTLLFRESKENSPIQRNLIK
jgi:O-antigen ligase